MVRRYKDLQDEINKRRSKALHALNARRVIADRGAVENVDKARFIDQLKPVCADFERQFGKANIDLIRNFK